MDLFISLNAQLHFTMRERFFSVVSKEQQWKFFEEYFTDVKVKGYLYDFLTLPWTYVYTLNIDDGIENTKLYKAVVPYAEANVPNSSMRLVYKLHGDAQSEILYKRKKNIVFSATQYIESLTSSENTTNSIFLDNRGTLLDEPVCRGKNSSRNVYY